MQAARRSRSFCFPLSQRVISQSSFCAARIAWKNNTPAFINRTARRAKSSGKPGEHTSLCGNDNNYYCSVTAHDGIISLLPRRTNTMIRRARAHQRWRWNYMGDSFILASAVAILNRMQWQWPSWTASCAQLLWSHPNRCRKSTEILSKHSNPIYPIIATEGRKNLERRNTFTVLMVADVSLYIFELKLF
jgi:hypothetical protein